MRYNQLAQMEINMKIIIEYSWEHIRRNWRASIAVMVAVLMSSTMLLSMCLLGGSFWKWMVEDALYAQGNWHGELYQDTPGSHLAYIEGNPQVESVMIKGTWYGARLPEAAPDYLILRDANQSYWEHMPEKNSLISGRLPMKTGEIVVSKTFFEEYPQFHLGDSLTLPIGERVLEDIVLDIRSIRREGESFRQQSEQTFTIVGVMDTTTTSAYPGYYALGYLDETQIAPTDQLTVYLRFYNMRDTYKLLPGIAKSVGQEKDAYGEYSLRYHGNLLILYGIFAPSIGAPISFAQAAQGAMSILAIVLVLWTFALIIRGVFSLSAEMRLKQYGIMRSIGASPRQIRSAVFWEAIFLSVIPILLSVLLGYIFTDRMLGIFNHYVGELMTSPVLIFISLPLICLGILLSFITVFLAAGKPAKQMSALTPIEAVLGKKRQQLTQTSKKKYWLTGRFFGFPGELARETLYAHRKTMRSPVAAMCISLVLVGGAIGMPAVSNAHNAIADQGEVFNIRVNVSLTDSLDPVIAEEIRNVPGVTGGTYYLSTSAGMTVAEKEETEEFIAIGGFGAVADQSRFAVETVTEGYRIRSMLLGLDEESFRAYCQSIGVAYEEQEDITTSSGTTTGISVPVNANAQQEIIKISSGTGISIPVNANAQQEIIKISSGTGISIPVNANAQQETIKISSGTSISIQGNAHRQQEDIPSAILVNGIRANPGARTIEEQRRIVPMLRVEAGDTFFLDELFQENQDTEPFSVKIDHVTLEYPELDLYQSQYCPVFVMPISTYYSIVEHFSPERAGSYYQTNWGLITKEEDQLAVEEQIKAICANYFPKSDYYVESQAGRMANTERLYTAIQMMDTGIAILFAIIGIFNAFSSVTGNLRLRRREFAMLRSVGLDTRGLRQILTLEGTFFAIRPVILSIPILAGIYGIFLWMLDVPLSLFLGILPWCELLMYMCFVLVVMGLAYLYGAASIRKDTIADTLRDTTM
jgi:ABC-type antimicrobial peptide transport system permease subunit